MNYLSFFALRRHRVLRWISLLILVLASLAPGVSRCLHTEAGVALVHELAGHHRSTDVTVLDHCGLCLAHPASDVLPLSLPWLSLPTFRTLPGIGARAISVIALAAPRPAARDPPRA